MKILQNNKEITTIDLGMLKIGETKVYEYTLENDSNWEITDIKLSLKEIDGKHVNEVSFIDYPTSLLPNQRAKLKFSWSPNVVIKKGLKTQLQIKALEIWN